jgi:chorismate synthase
LEPKVPIRLLTGGESHGKGTVVILEGVPSNLTISSDDIDRELSRRQKGYGRGGRMLIENDRVEILSGVRKGITLGSPITLFVKNNDYKNWEKIMSPDFNGENTGNPLQRPRPGHADLTGGLKYNERDLRNILERASARETTVRVAAGAVAKKFLKIFKIDVQSHVVQLGNVHSRKSPVSFHKLNLVADQSPVRMLDKKSEKEAIALIDVAKGKGDTLGGVFEVVITGVPAGLGSHVQWDRKLDGRLAQSVMSLQAIKGVEIGRGFENAGKFGSQVHDEIGYKKEKGFYHFTNRAGGIEGGMSNGEAIIVRAAKKPISTLRKPLRSVNIQTKKETKAAYERSDVCALPAASVIGEAVCAWVMADALLEKTGGDFMEEVQDRFNVYKKHLEKY